MEGVKVSISANKGRVGKDFGDLQPLVIAKIDEVNSILIDHFDAETKYETEIEGKRIVLVKDHLDVHRTVPEPYVGNDFKGGVVYLDTTRTPELDSEGYARELMRQVQQLRKKAELKKGQKVNLTIQCSAELEQMLSRFKEQIIQKVGAASVSFGSVSGEHTSSAKIKEESTEIGIALV